MRLVPNAYEKIAYGTHKFGHGYTSGPIILVLAEFIFSVKSTLIFLDFPAGIITKYERVHVTTRKKLKLHCYIATGA